MALATNIVLADAQATPVNKTFNPVGLNPSGVFEYMDMSGATAAGYWKVTVELKRPPAPTAGTSTKDRMYRMRITLSQPILETVSNNTASGIAPAPTISYIPRAVTEFIVPERASLQNRKDLRKMASNLLAHADIVNVVENLNYLS